ncbi:hypothetical protein Efla_002288 [Eimeria flavescens]
MTDERKASAWTAAALPPRPRSRGAALRDSCYYSLYFMLRASPSPPFLLVCWRRGDLPAAVSIHHSRRGASQLLGGQPAFSRAPLAASAAGHPSLAQQGGPLISRPPAARKAVQQRSRGSGSASELAVSAASPRRLGASMALPAALSEGHWWQGGEAAGAASTPAAVGAAAGNACGSHEGSPHGLRCTCSCMHAPETTASSNSSSSSSSGRACGCDARRRLISSTLRASLMPEGPSAAFAFQAEQQQQQQQQQLLLLQQQCNRVLQQTEETEAVRQALLVEALPLLPLAGTPSLLPSSVGCMHTQDSSSNSSSRSCVVDKGQLPPFGVRRCSSSGAAPNHVSGSRHSSSSLLPPGLPTPSSSRLTLSSSCSKKSSSGGCRQHQQQQQQALPWLPPRRFSFSGLTTRSLCACRPSPIVAATRSSSSSSSSSANCWRRSELLSDCMPFKGHAAAGRRSSKSSNSSNGSSSSVNSSRSSSRSSSSISSSEASSLWEGDRQPLLPSHAAASAAAAPAAAASASAAAAAGGDSEDGAAVLQFDDPLVRLQSLRLQQQPRSPLLLRCCTPQEEDMLQPLGGDTTCPAAAAEEMAPSQSDTSEPPLIPATVGSFYGFTFGPEVAARVAAYEEKTAGQRKKQANRWAAYLARCPKLEDRKALKRLVRRGIPDELRQLWARFLGADALLAEDPEAFQRLQEEELPREVSGQIELDLPRTFPNNKRFRGSGGIAALRRVLRGFAAARPSVGYCQGLNFLAATLLLFQNQQLALASLLQLVVSRDKSTGLQIGRYYSDGMTDLRRDLKVFEILIRQKSPRVYRVLQKTGVEVEWLAAEWFLCLFCTSCPKPTVLRIWDCLMLEGPKILFRVALGVILWFESQLARMHLLEQVMGFLKSNLALMVEHNELLHSCFNKLRSFPRRKLQQLQRTVAAGLSDPLSRASQELEQQHQPQGEEEQQQQQPAASASVAVSRRLKLLSFGRLSRSDLGSEASVRPPPQQTVGRWRQRLSRVNVRLRERGSSLLSSSMQASSQYAVSRTPAGSTCSAHAQASGTLQLLCLDTAEPTSGSGGGPQPQLQPTLPSA